MESFNIGTNYYKLAHLSSINYYTYISSLANEHNLLEIELQIRHKYPKILLSYYGKCLFYFTFGHIDSLENNSGIDLVNQFPGLELTNASSVTIEQLTSQPKPVSDPIGSSSSDKNGQPTENYMALASCLVKTIKKMILFNLSLNKVVTLFGNYCLIDQKTHYSCMFIDPILIPNGDILISVMTKTHPKLFPSELVTKDLYKSNFGFNFAIYLIPSGIRCHLFDPNVFENNIVKNMNDSSHATLINLIKISTGIDVSSELVLWVKLIPNLKHINGNTSPISKFIHTVENKKSILWPWHLCCLQFGKVQDIDTTAVEAAPSSNPLSLISEFLDFNIGQNQLHQNQNHQNQHSALSHLSAQSLGGDNELNSVEHVDLNTPNMFGVQNDTEDNKPDTLMEDVATNHDKDQEVVNPQKLEDDMEIDDLFGASDGSDDNIETAPKNESDNITESQSVVVEKEPFKEKDEGMLDSLDVKLQDLSSAKEKSIAPEAKLPDGFYKNDLPKTLKNSIIDIPRDQMTVSKTITPMYNDPGAPVPVSFTPIIPQSVPSVASTVAPSSVGPTIEEPTKSVFSPIIFNPIIKSNIDTKYGKGGKFYVDKETVPDEDFVKKKKSIRATSVSGIELPLSKEISMRNTSYEPVIDETDDSMSGTSEESDEDEEQGNDLHNMTPLKLYTVGDNFQNQTSMPNQEDLRRRTSNSADSPPKPKSVEKQFSNFKNFGTGALASPNLNSRFATFRGDSPFFANDLGQIGSPIDFDQTTQPSPVFQQSPNSQQSSGAFQNPEIVSHRALDSGLSAETPKGMAEFLSLILRSVNVNSIPNEYLLNNLMSDKLMPSLDINDVEKENDLELTKNNEMIVKSKNIEQLLKYLTANLVFDLGLNRYGSESSYHFGDSDNRKIKDPQSKLIDFCHPDCEFDEHFFRLFPNSYRVSLAELMLDPKDFEESDSLDNQLDFLDEITSDFDLLNPRNQFKKLKTLEWDSIISIASEESAKAYKNIVAQLCTNLKVKEDAHFKLPMVKATVMKNKTVLNLNSIGLDFWKLLNFSPVKKEKNFQIIMISEVDEGGSIYAHEFLNLLTSSYNECNLGKITHINLVSGDSRPELESINNGLILLNKEMGQSYNDFYNQVDKSLSNLVEMIKQDLMTKTNSFEFDKPLLLLFVNFNKNLNSMLQISKIFRNFKVALQTHQLPLVKVFTKIIPSSFIVKQKNRQSRLKTLGNMKMAKLALNLYNQCPNACVQKELTKNLYTQLVREPPSKIQFKFMNSKGKTFNDDVFLHLAYERSVDKNWIAAAWSDPTGIVTYSKCWYCSQSEGDSKDGSTDLGSVIDDIWSICCDLFKRVNDELNKSNALGGKKFLVLTRINSVIPEMELYHWKRLSVKHKDISLIVLSVNRAPKLVFTNEGLGKNNDITSEAVTTAESGFATSSLDMPPVQSQNDKEAYLKTFAESNNPSPNGYGATSPSNVINFHSPQNFLSATGNFLSPQDIGSVQSSSTNLVSPGGDADMILHDISSDIYGIVPKLPLPSFFSNNRSGYKLGYLLKEFTYKSQTGHLVFEVCILSCSNFWNSNTLLTLLLNHYKKLILLNDILGLRYVEGNNASSDQNAHEEQETSDFEVEGIIPWHIAAVGKALDYLVHIYVED